MRPSVLILDEPTAGLDPKGRDEILDRVKALQEERGVTVVLVSHSMEDVARLVERIIVMEKGRVALDGTPTEVFRQAEQLKSMGLGVPQVTDLMRELQRRGMEVDSDIFRVEDAEREIMRVLGERI